MSTESLIFVNYNDIVTILDIEIYFFYHFEKYVNAKFDKR